ncbi:MAG TPA: molecular chaperone [Variovorax sp.]|nr:molecular chaperone [Variovorax sp.]
MIKGLRCMVLSLVALGCALPSWASVVMTGTRVIYPGGAKERSIQFTNPDDAPSVLQIWIDSGNADSTPETAEAPFVATPPVFRIEPKSGQTARLIFTGKGLPQDRESVFFLNTIQIPALSTSHAERNKMLLLLRNRIKLFYRPAGIAGDPERAADTLSFSAVREGDDWKITATNDSAFHISLTDARITGAGEDIVLAPDMLAPKASFDWRIKSGADLLAAGSRISFSYVNDYGGDNKGELPLAARR